MYDEVRGAEDPAALILAFAQSTYEAGARLQGWPVDELKLRAAGGERAAPTSQLAATKAPNPTGL